MGRVGAQLLRFKIRNPIIRRPTRMRRLIALVGAPLALTYTAIVYWTFRGKVSNKKLIY